MSAVHQIAAQTLPTLKVFFGRARQTLQFLQGVGLMELDPMQWGEYPQTTANVIRRRV